MGKNPYEEYYQEEGYYWGRVPSRRCYQVLALKPPVIPLKLLDIGCGEGKNAVFFARNGYQVTAFDASLHGIEKAQRLAQEVGVEIELFQEDILTYRLEEEYDILFASGVLHYLTPSLRGSILDNYKEKTKEKGLHVFNVFVVKSFLPKAPDEEETSQTWISGELFTHYHSWYIHSCGEEIIDCDSSGVPHQHAMNYMIAQKTTG